MVPLNGADLEPRVEAICTGTLIQPQLGESPSPKPCRPGQAFPFMQL